MEEKYQNFDQHTLKQLKNKTFSLLIKIAIQPTALQERIEGINGETKKKKTV
jgi:uncharacterized protein YggU (UPF0235/DUF167 family)